VESALTEELDRKVAAAVDLLQASVRDYGRVTYANSLGAEAMVLTDLVWAHAPQIHVFTIDTGRLHQETYSLLEALQRRRGSGFRVMFPATAAVEGVVSTFGVNGFYDSLEARLACCRARKIEPFRRAIAGYAAWVTGVRRDQSAARTRIQPLEWDTQYGLYKVSPLLDWAEPEIWQYIRARRLPYNELHDRQYPSIGCAPCTRAVNPGEGSRAGRWWWEEANARECGLHPTVPDAGTGQK
jgi:phosphoadenosine phosphosulfate reductase